VIHTSLISKVYTYNYVSYRWLLLETDVLFESGRHYYEYKGNIKAFFLFLMTHFLPMVLHSYLGIHYNKCYIGNKNE
jgi:hypothetical protein